VQLILKIQQRNVEFIGRELQRCKVLQDECLKELETFNSLLKDLGGNYCTMGKSCLS